MNVSYLFVLRKDKDGWRRARQALEREPESVLLLDVLDLTQVRGENSNDRGFRTHIPNFCITEKGKGKRVLFTIL